MRKDGSGRGSFVPSFLILVVLGLGGFAAHTFGQDQVDDFYPGCLRVVWSMALEPDGKILVGGWFNIGGEACVARVNADGTLDTAFRSVATGRGIPETTV